MNKRNRRSGKQDLRMIVREELSRAKVNEGQVVKPKSANSPQMPDSTPLRPSRFDSTRLGGSPNREAQILQFLMQQRGAPGSPSANFVPADQSIMDLMYHALAPQDPNTATPLYSPGVPLLPIPGITPPTGPRQWSFPVGDNISTVPRGDSEYSFADLRSVAKIYDGIQICEQVWLDYVGRLKIRVEPIPSLVEDNQDQSVYAKDIAFYEDFFAYPDRENGLSFRDWIRQAVKEQLEVDALAIYPHLANDGTLHSLEILDGATIKPLIDDRGRRPEPPFPAYAQYLYRGVPVAWLSADELVYMKETSAVNQLYGTPRVEKIMLRVNQALRKQSKDLLRFTEGTVPAGMIQVPSDSPWTQDQLEEFEVNLNALMAGNDMARARLKVLPKGFVYLPTDDPAVNTLFDTVLMNITASAFGLTMAELGFVEDVNRASGESQENVVYRRTMQPLMSRYEDLFTHILRKYFNETRFRVCFHGFEEVEDFQTKASTYVALVQAGIQSPTQAAQALKLPVYDDMNVPPFIMMPSGPFVVSDLANDQLRQAQVQSQITSLTTPPVQPGAKPADGSQPADGPQDEDEPDQKTSRAEYRRWRECVLKDIRNGKPIRAFQSTIIPTPVLTAMSTQLQRCETPDEVRAVFSSWHGSQLGV